MICQACAGESAKVIGGIDKLLGCKSCTSERLLKQGFISQASAVKFCVCFALRHTLFSSSPLSPPIKDKFEKNQSNQSIIYHLAFHLILKQGGRKEGGRNHSIKNRI